MRILGNFQVNFWQLLKEFYTASKKISSFYQFLRKLLSVVKKVTQFLKKFHFHSVSRKFYAVPKRISLNLREFDAIFRRI